MSICTDNRSFTVLRHRVCALFVVCRCARVRCLSLSFVRSFAAVFAFMSVYTLVCLLAQRVRFCYLLLLLLAHFIKCCMHLAFSAQWYAKINCVNCIAFKIGGNCREFVYCITIVGKCVCVRLLSNIIKKLTVGEAREI